MHTLVLSECSLDDERASKFIDGLVESQTLPAADAAADAARTVITRVDMVANELGAPTCVRWAAALPSLSSLLVLMLDENVLRDDGGVALAEALALPACQLRELHVAKCKIRDVGGVALGRALATNVHLHTLELTNNRIGDEAAVALFDALAAPNRTLITLRLKNNLITDASCASIAAALATPTTALCSLSLDDNCLTPAGAAQLEAACAHNTVLQDKQRFIVELQADRQKLPAERSQSVLSPKHVSVGGVSDGAATTTTSDGASSQPACCVVQ